MTIRDGRGLGELDFNQRQADEDLQELERRLRRAYSEAGQGIQQRLDNFLDDFAVRDAEYLERVNAGTMSMEEYITWRTNKILRTRQMEAQIEAIAQDLVNCDSIAVDMINGRLPDVYASSYNFGLYRAQRHLAEYGEHTESSFALYNADALRILQTENPDLIPWDAPRLDIARDLNWNRQHIQAALTQGILQGDNIRQLSNRLLPIVNQDRVAATRTARTAYTNVQNAGRYEANNRVRQAGIDMQSVWLSVLQSNTRDTHLLLHGTTPNSDGLFGEGIIPTGNLLRYPADSRGDAEQIYNCQCRLQSYLGGVDHSRDYELYAEFMQRNYPADWNGEPLHEGGAPRGAVRDYRQQERLDALERRRQLQSGEIESRELQRYRRRQQSSELNTDEFFTDTSDHIASSGIGSVDLQARAGEIANMSNSQIWSRFTPDDSFIDSSEFIHESNLYAALTSERDELSAANRALTLELAGESQIKPRELWTDADRVEAILGGVPQQYTARGEEILATIGYNNERIQSLSPSISEIANRQDAIYRREALNQIRDWTAPPLVRASEGEHFIGFTTRTRSAFDEDLDRGVGYIASMSPREYLERISYEIFGSSIEQATAGIEYNNIREYAQMIAEGTQFDCGYIDYIRGSQEGRHRAMAAYLLGIERIPVYIRGK